MRRLGRPRVAATGTRWAFGASLAALTLLLAGCGGANPSGSEDPSPSASSESTSPSADATPSALKGGTRLEGPGFTLIVPPGYKLVKRDNGGEYSEWSRLYSLRANPKNSISVSHVTQSVLPLDKELENIRGYLTLRGIRRDQIRRAEDLTLAEHPTAHLVGISEYFKEAHAYLVQFGESYLEVFLERAPDDVQEQRTQQAVLDSIRLTGS